MKRILMITTGGTIASQEGEDGLEPKTTGQQMLDLIPELQGLCEIDCVDLLNLDSTNMQPEEWAVMAKAAFEGMKSHDGIVITHGTDTMAYTAAALSYMIQNSQKPIVITGSQKPINMDITDARTNLLDSFVYAADAKSQGVQIVFDGKVIAGTRAKKVRSKSYNAFSSIDFPSLAVIQDMNIMRYIPMIPYEDKVRFYTRMNDSIFLLKLIPGIRPEILPFIFEHYDAIVIESFGVGGIPHSIRDAFCKLCEEHPDKIIIMATQVAHEGSDMTVYEVGNEMKTMCNFLETYDMTLESAIAKTMWMSANVDWKRFDREDIFYKNINYDVIFGKNRKC